MKFVYVLASDGSDCYAEQTYISMYSLRKHNPGCHITLATEESTRQRLTGRLGGIRDFADEITLFDLPDNLSLLQKSRYIKTTIRQKIEGDFLYIDSDTLILGSLKELENVRNDVSAIRLQSSEDWGLGNPHGMLRTFNKIRGVEPTTDYGITDYYNGGVILARDTPQARALFQSWHELWRESSMQYGFHKDQCALWRANKLNGNIIQPIDGKYNLQAICPNIALRYLGDCRVFHYLSSARFLKKFRLKEREFLERMLDAGNAAELDNLLTNIKTEYLNGLTIYTDPDALKWTDSTLVQLARKVSTAFPAADRAIARLWRLFHR